MKETFAHRPVLLDECLTGLAIKPNGIYIDGTFGRGGHSAQIAARLGAGGKLICIDRDRQALDEGAQKLAAYQDRVQFLHGNFADLDVLLKEAGVETVDGMLFDFGVSSPQLDDGARGFSYQKDAPLDMRMNQADVLSAHIVVNEWPQTEIRRVLSEYGEERFASSIARAICRVREEKYIETTLELVDVIRSAMPAAALREKQHPAKRSFQGIRIAVNDELGAIRDMLRQAIGRLNPEGRIAVISFHSLEDRIVKTELAHFAQGCDCPSIFPVCICGKKPILRLVPRKPIVPSETEIAENPRARSAKLRVAEKI